MSSRLAELLNKPKPDMVLITQSAPKDKFYIMPSLPESKFGFYIPSKLIVHPEDWPWIREYFESRRKNRIYEGSRDHCDPSAQC